MTWACNPILFKNVLHLMNNSNTMQTSIILGVWWNVKNRLVLTGNVWDSWMYDTLNNTTIHASTFTFSYHVTKSIKSFLGVTEIKATPPPSIIDLTTIFYESFFYYLHILIFGLLQLKHFFSLMQEKHIYRYIPVIVCFPYFFFNWPCFWSPTSYLYSVYRSAHFILREKCQLFVNSSNTLTFLFLT